MLHIDSNYFQGAVILTTSLLNSCKFDVCMFTFISAYNDT